MEQFQIDFRILVLDREGVRLNSFFKECLDSFEEEAVEFLQWFMKYYTHRHINIVEAEQMLPLFEDLFSKWYYELKTKDMFADE